MHTYIATFGHLSCEVAASSAIAAQYLAAGILNVLRTYRHMIRVAQKD